MVPYDRSFFSEAGGGRFSRVNSLSCNILHVIVQICSGGVIVTRISVKELLPTLGDRVYETMIL